MITDEMVEVACAAAGDTIATGYHARRDRPSKRCAEREMRAALEAVLPMIRAEVLEECARALDGIAIGHRRVADMHNKENYERGMTLALAAAKTAEVHATTIRAMKGTSHE